MVECFMIRSNKCDLLCDRGVTTYVEEKIKFLRPGLVVLSFKTILTSWKEEYMFYINLKKNIQILKLNIWFFAEP